MWNSCLQDNPFPFQHIAAKIDQQTNAKFRGGQIVQHLFDVRVGQFFNGLGLKENLIPDDEVRLIIVWKDNSFVRDLVIFLARKRNSSATQFNNESVLVNNFVVDPFPTRDEFPCKNPRVEKLLPCRAVQTQKFVVIRVIRVS